MNRLFYLFAIVSILYLGYVYQNNNKNKTSISIVSDLNLPGQEEIIANFVKNEESTKKVIISAEQREKQNTLPPGVYILLKYSSCETDSGIIGYPPGSILTKHNLPNQYCTRDNRILTLKESEVTNNIETARPYVSADYLNQLNLIRSKNE